jgi:uncharacterized iron-regulated membrane protein
MLSIRLWHSYIGILIAPSVIFFALTGALQIFSLHESHGSYTPPVIIEKLSSMHKDQVFEQKHHDDDEAQSKDGRQPPPPREHEAGPTLGTMLLKWFFLFVALALTASTVLGLWIGLTRFQRKRTGWWLLLAGIILPIGLFVI